MSKKMLVFSCLFIVIAALIFCEQVFAEETFFEEESDLFDMSIEELMEVQIESTATLTEAKPRLVPAAVTTITQEQIHSSGARSLFELLDIYVPNFQWIFHSAEVKHMGLRGIISNLDDKYLLQVNGKIMNEKTDMGAWTERDLPMLSDIHHIDVVRGPGSAMYGPGALAMVINIVTHNANTFQGLETTTKVGSIEEFYSSEFKYGKKFNDDSGIFLYIGATEYPGATHDHSPSVLGRSDTIFGKTYQAGDEVTDYMHGMNESFQDKTKWKLYGQYTNGDLNIWGRFTSGGEYQDLYNNAWWLPSETRWFDEGSGYQQGTAYISYDQKILPELSVNYVFSYDMTQVQSESYALRLRSFQENEYYGRIVANWKPHEQHSFALGGEWSHEEFGLPHTSYPDKGIWFQMTGMATSFDDSTAMPRWSTNLKSVFTEYQWNINDQWTTFVGARLDDHPYTEQMFSPRGALIYTPTDKDTVKLIASRSSRTDSAALMKLNRSNGGENNVETLKSIELRYERQQTENLWLAGDIFYNWHDILGVGADWVGNKLLGEMKSYGFELEASYRKGKTRVDLSHSMSKMLEFDLNNGITSLEITAAPFGYGNDLANWSNHTTKLVVHYDLAERWKLDSSANVYWGYPGGEDYAEYKNDTSSLHDVYKPGFSKSFRPSIFVNLGVEHKISKNKTLRVDGYNLLGFIDHDLNKRRVGFNTDYPAQYRCHAPAVGISYQHKF